MDERIRTLLERGWSREEVFEELQGEAGNETRLANKIATFRTRKETGLPLILNWILLGLTVIQGTFAVWVIKTSLPAMYEMSAQFGVIVVSILTVVYFFYLARMAFIGYASFLLFCLAAAAHYVYVVQWMPLISIAGLSLSLITGAVTYYLKIRLFPHMGMLNVRKDGRQRYILE